MSSFLGRKDKKLLQWLMRGNIIRNLGTNQTN